MHFIVTTISLGSSMSNNGGVSAFHCPFHTTSLVLQNKRALERRIRSNKRIETLNLYGFQTQIQHGGGSNKNMSSVRVLRSTRPIRRASLIPKATTTSTSGIPGVDYISGLSVFLAMLPILSTIMVSHFMKLNLRSRVFVSVFRNFVQLSALSFILRPIFTLQKPILVISYMMVLTVMAAFESSRRTKYVIKSQFTTTLVSLLSNVILTTLYAFSIVIKPTPFYNPQCVIPVCGMLLGNCINGVSLSLNSLTSSIIEKQREIELYLSFGATGNEAVNRLLRESIQAGLTPVLNNMSVMGLISIPGMMTGQILGGSSAVQAARWQMLIMYLVASSIFGTVLMQNLWTTRNAFSIHGIRKELLGKRVKRKWIDRVQNWRKNEEPPLELSNKVNGDHSIEVNIKSFASKESIEMGKKVFQVDDVAISVTSTATSSNGRSEQNVKRVLFQNLSFLVKEGEIAFINGPSGSGKSSLLRALAKLSPPENGNINLSGVDLNGSSESWRKHVRYLTQYKVDVPGTPMQSIDKFSTFQSWTKESSNKESAKEEMKKETIRLIQKFNLSETILDQDWITLSGGESQRVILAMAIASRPNVLLLDESTSALDQKSKIIVERTVVEEISKKGMIAIWISHDSDREHLFTTGASAAENIYMANLQ